MLEGDGGHTKDLKDLLGNKSIDEFLDGKNRGQRKVLKYTLEALSNENEEVKKYHDDIVNDERVYKKLAIDEISKNEKLRNGMLSAISEEFPLKSVSSGEEKMAIGDMGLNKEVMKQIFGTDKWDEIKEKLVVVGGEEPCLAYKADVMGKEIPIAKIKVREDGVGYGGQFKFEMQLDSRFAKEVKVANKGLYSSEEEKPKEIYDILQKRLSILLEKYL